MENAIPKVIHYCWFGGKELPESVKRCIESWKRMCPEYMIVQWDESNYDYTKNKYMYEAYQAKKYSFVSDYARLDVIYQNGGIYLDTDVELVKSLDSLLCNEAFAGIENTEIAFGLGFGARKGTVALQELMSQYEKVSFIRSDGSLNLTPMPVYTTEYFVSRGYEMRRRNKIQQVASFVIYPAEYFNPKDRLTGEIKLSARTFSIHHYDASWHGVAEQRDLNRQQRLRKKSIWLWRVYNGFKTIQKEGISSLIKKIRRMRIDK